MTPGVYAYLLQHTREPQVLRDLRQETSRMPGSHMQITPEQGALLGLMVQLTGAQRVVEVGVFTGYSSLAMALALPAGGRLVALDKDPKTMAVAQEFWKAAGVSGKVEAMVGPALDSLRQLLERDGPGSYDMGFIDADKRAYEEYYALLMQLVRPGGLIAVDNVLFYGRVANPEATDKAAQALAAFNTARMRDERIDFCIIPIGDGMALCRRR